MKGIEWGKDKQKIMTWVMGGALLVVVMVCAAAVVVLVANKNRSSVDVGVEESEQGSIFDSWGEYITNKDMDGLIEFTNKQIEATDDAETKAMIYESRAGVLYSFDAENENDEYKAQILSDVYSAEEYYPTGDTAYLIYMYEQAYGNTVVAEEYLKIAEERGETISPGKG